MSRELSINTEKPEAELERLKIEVVQKYGKGVLEAVDVPHQLLPAPETDNSNGAQAAEEKAP